MATLKAAAHLNTRNKKPALSTPVLGSGKANVHVKKKKAIRGLIASTPLAPQTSEKAQAFKNPRSSINHVFK